MVNARIKAGSQRVSSILTCGNQYFPTKFVQRHPLTKRGQTLYCCSLFGAEQGLSQ